ncbi:MAG: carbohydrate-binding family 9-like protein [Clostridia bacterium]|nr:carbohydrate-binding family 9-like protein [Clostridia bacterium]
MMVELKDNVTGEKTPFKTILEYSRFGNNMLFKFTCEKSKRFSAYSEHNEPIYRGDVCEVFICTGEDLSEYYEIEVAPNGATFFAKIKNNDGQLVTSFLEKNFTSKVTLTESGYDVEILIPFDAVNAGAHPIRFNAYRIETEGGYENRHLLALSPTKRPFFHCPESFVRFHYD